LHEGSVVEQGTHEELLSREDSLYRHYHSLQFRWDEEQPLDLMTEPAPPEAQEREWAGSGIPFLSQKGILPSFQEEDEESDRVS
jgi:hypothetical protein